MPKNWKTYNLGELISYQKGFAFKSDWYKEKGELIVRISDTTSNSIDISSCHRVDKDKALELQRYKLEKDDIVIATVGSWPPNYASVVGKVIKVPSEANGALLNQNAVRLKSIDETLHSKKYIYYLMKSEYFLRYIVNTAQGSASQASIKLTDIFDFKFNIPSIKEQQAIASILSAIDDKIENNLAINKTLEEMAMALYKHWFIDFGPFQDGEFVESELGMIPKGWEVKKLDEISYVKGGKRLPKGSQLQKEPNDHPYIRVKDFNSIFLINTGLEYVPNEIFNSISNYIVNTKDIVLTIVGTIGSVAIIGDNINKASLTENCVKITAIHGKINSELIFMHLKSYDIMEELKNKTVGSTQPKLPIYNIKDLKIKLPIDYSTISKPLSEIINSLDEIYNNSIENQTLTQLRETLLPQLISGTVRLKEFRKTVEELV